MKKLLFVFAGAILLPYFAKAGGIVTNTNQSAYWVRTLTRDASTGIDAVYFNPAGLGKLDDGFHFSLSSQTIFQSKDVTATYNFLNTNPNEYKGDVKAPVFPSFYAAWKKNKLAISFGFNPVGGGGGAEYLTGLPSFEIPLSDLDPIVSGLLAPLDQGIASVTGTNPQFSNIQGYSADIYFKGSSVFFGYQLGLTYQITDMIGVYAGARYVTAKNTYDGHIRDIMINPQPLNTAIAGPQTPGDYLRQVALTPGLDEITVATLNFAATNFDQQTTDKEVDAEEKGSGITPILGANVSLMDKKLNIGLKYEFKTRLELETTVNDGKDGYGLFKQDSLVNSDMPAMLSLGASFQATPKLGVTAGFHYYFDKNANYGKTLDSAPTEPVTNDEVMDANFYELGLGLEYGITDKLLASAGYLFANTGVTEDYQSDLSFSLTSSTIGLGIGFKITEKIMINLGGAYTMYQEGEKNFTHDMPTVPVATPVPVKYEFYKDNLIIGLGLDFSF
jgi:long-subunit fatty acid transport protein